MKKILISIIIILLLLFAYFTLIKGDNAFNIKSINEVKAASQKLADDYNEANNLTNNTYPTEVEGLNEAIKKLKISKKDFENKNKSDEISIGTVEIKTYKIHYLWTILGNYRKNRGVQSLNLDLKSTQSQDVYDLEFTLQGKYTSITDFLYDIENDEELNFEIKNFVISSEITPLSSSTANDSKNEETQENTSENIEKNVLDNNKNTQTTDSTQETNSNNEEQTTQKSDGVTLQAKFTVENVGITLD